MASYGMGQARSLTCLQHAASHASTLRLTNAIERARCCTSMHRAAHTSRPAAATSQQAAQRSPAQHPAAHRCR